MAQPKDPRPVFDYALANCPHLLQVSDLDSLLTETARANAKRSAYLQFEVPDELVVNVRGEESRRDLLLVIRIPNEVVKRSQRRIVLPGEV